jgi:hypothetical protein
MKWDDHRSWVLGSIATIVITFSAAVFTVIYAAYYNRTHHIAEWGAFVTTLRIPVPLWFVFLLSVLTGGLGFYGFRIKRKAEKLQTTKISEPELHLAWHGTAGWGSTDDLKEMIIITKAHLKGAEYVGNFGSFAIRPGTTFHQSIMLNFRGVRPESGKPLTVKLTFEDNKGRLYETRETTFRAFPGPQMPPPEA